MAEHSLCPTSPTDLLVTAKHLAQPCLARHSNAACYLDLLKPAGRSLWVAHLATKASLRGAEIPYQITTDLDSCDRTATMRMLQQRAASLAGSGENFGKHVPRSKGPRSSPYLDEAGVGQVSAAQGKAGQDIQSERKSGQAGCQFRSSVSAEFCSTSHEEETGSHV
jgi:hypothetical protein